jgi:hypothetical protein
MRKEANHECTPAQTITAPANIALCISQLHFWHCAFALRLVDPLSRKRPDAQRHPNLLDFTQNINNGFKEAWGPWIVRLPPAVLPSRSLCGQPRSCAHFRAKLLTAVALARPSPACMPAAQPALDRFKSLTRA